jgi:hypothetical protein
MHFAGFANFKGVCPAGGQHEQTNSFAYSIEFDSPNAISTQSGWAACPKCQGLHFAGFPNFKGVCPAGGQHEQTNSFAYSMPHDIPATANFQSDFRSCKKCQGLFFGPFAGRCPAGGEHDSDGSFNYAMRLQPPAISLRLIADQGRFVEVTGTNFTCNKQIMLTYSMTDQGEVNTHTSGTENTTSDAAGKFTFRIRVTLSSISFASVKATDVASGGETTASI